MTHSERNKLKTCRFYDIYHSLQSLSKVINTKLSVRKTIM